MFDLTKLFEWDDEKRYGNKSKHGLDFADVTLFDFDNCMEENLDAREFGEERVKAIGILDDMICTLIYTMRENKRRIISLRKATRREIAGYVEYLKT